MALKVCETFYSLMGESTLAGAPAFFPGEDPANGGKDVGRDEGRPLRARPERFEGPGSIAGQDEDGGRADGPAELDVFDLVADHVGGPKVQAEIAELAPDEQAEYLAALGVAENGMTGESVRHSPLI